ncbi:hypothetical protein LEP1GSC037_0398 [Leptospira interrogans str. 2006001854]|uniref:Uncharacterized protein n=1 Tax=Leptospira interrogans str. 2006001854 TaxID=1001590 RepID=M6G9W2_LEPIR|nr:hypothetical protein LEP1GSC080_0063 [Leptospira interrogans str. FPW2026]EMM79344.1 hypothetical protein LEP1GSC037_0398 [Leptospira interrogans str. 2006001854]EMN54134.1 hypothetical protein LEP1GSC089_0674 [Leptospira interrogans serovar Autumnalis str. LP101]EMN72207.1 hypothetical protein LEP1GSC100_1991 [Leptospira interrogans serovar Bataviae str. UI 08561]
MCIFKNGLRGFFFGGVNDYELKRLGLANAMKKMQLQQFQG